MAERLPPSHRDSYARFIPHSTRWNDNDVYGHLNNVVHYELFDTTVNTWLMQEGLLSLGASAVIGLVAETGCRYHSEIVFPDVVTAGLRVARLGTSSVRYEIGLFRNESPVAAAEGFFVHVYVDAATRKPTPLPAGHRQAMERLIRG